MLKMHRITMPTPLDPEILDQIRAILRRDLKLSATTPLPEDMPFFGGDIDLDSLDMLLLVTSIERHWGVRIPNESVGKEVFHTVATLARYVQEHRNSTASSPAAPQPVATDWLSFLPHGPEFRFISKVTEVMPGEFARGQWNLTGQEYFFKGHFPNHPIVPGVLIIESLAQLSGLAGQLPKGTAGKIAQVDVRFTQSVSPPATIELEAKISRTLGELQMCDVIARHAGNIIASGVITLHLQASEK